MIRVNKCCCCIELTTGGQILGWIGVFSSIIYLMFSGAFLISYDNWVERLNELGKHEEAHGLATYKIVVMFMLTIILITAVINLICSILLIRGVMIRKPDLILPWLIIQAFAIILQILGSFGSADGFDEVFSSIIGLGIEMYFWVCVHSLYTKLKTPEFQGVVYSAPLVSPPAYKV